MNILQWLTSRKYRYFYRKVKDVQSAIWELDFKIAKSRQVREGIRQDRDRAVETMNMIATQIRGMEAQASQSEEDAVKKQKLENDLAVVKDNQGRYEKQMKMIDDQIQGVPATQPTEIDPEGNPGMQGLNESIASYAELREMYKDFITKI